MRHELPPDRLTRLTKICRSVYIETKDQETGERIDRYKVIGFDEHSLTVWRMRGGIKISPPHTIRWRDLGTFRIIGDARWQKKADEARENYYRRLRT